MEYAIRIEPKNVRVGVHAMTCAARAGKGALVDTIEAPTAADAAKAYDAQEQLTARGFKVRVCGCCK